MINMTLNGKTIPLQPYGQSFEVREGGNRLSLYIGPAGKWSLRKTAPSTITEVAAGSLSDAASVKLPKTAKPQIAQLNELLRDLVSHIDAAIHHVCDGGGSKSQLKCSCGTHVFSKYANMTCKSFNDALAAARCRIRM